MELSIGKSLPDKRKALVFEDSNIQYIAKLGKSVAHHLVCVAHRQHKKQTSFTDRTLAYMTKSCIIFPITMSKVTKQTPKQLVHIFKKCNQ